MQMKSGWIAEARRRPVPEVATLLGMDVRRDRCGPCPACGDLREKSVRRLLVGIQRGEARWTCNHCKVSGDVIDLVAWKLTGRPCGELDQDGWSALREWFGVSPVRPPQRIENEPPPDYPPQQAVLALWSRCGSLLGPEGGVSRWLRSRGLNGDLVAALDLVRVAPSDKPERIHGSREVQHWGWPWIAALPLFDATGAHRSLLFRAVAAPPDWLPRKSLALRDYARAGLVLADPLGVALLSGRQEHQGIAWDGRILVCEGEPDMLTLAAHPDRVRQGCSFAVIGTAGAVPLSKEVGKRFPAEASVLLCPDLDADGKGEQTMMRSRMEALAHVKNVQKINLRKASL